MSDQVTLFGHSVSLLQVGLFVAGLAVGVTSSWFASSRAPSSPSPAPTPAPVVSKPAEKAEEESEEEEEEEDEEYDSDFEYHEEDDEDPENVPHKLLLIVRTDLKMGHGKAAAQCSHATLGAYKTARKTNPKALRFWAQHGQAKVAVKIGSEAEMDAIRDAAKAAGIITTVISDAGRTQIAAGSRTVLALGPAPSDKIAAVAGHLKLY